MKNILETSPAADALLDLRCAAAPELGALRDEVRGFCESKLPDDIRTKVLLNQHLTKDDHLRWHRILHSGGLLVGHWPKEQGGRGWSRLERWVFENEIYRAGSPWLVPFGITYLGPVVFTFGDAAQKARWLPPTAESQIWWAQGYSEPNAGSDLASIRTRGVRNGDDFVVSGQKTWTTMAHWADMMFTLVRTATSDRPQTGISFLLIDLSSPGVTIRPIPTIDCEHHINEVFLDEVRVPAENLIGGEGAGWTIAKYLLGNERLLAAEVGKARRLLRQLDTFIQLDDGDTNRASIWRRRRAELEARTLGLESISYDLLAEADAGRDPGPLASMLKLVGSELIQAINSAALDALGGSGLSISDTILQGGQDTDRLPSGGTGAIAEYLHGRAATIYGGSSEIQRNILAKAVLGL
jgi:alkylation response protein AidB-like acyl-CoA dehydrogenase